MYKRVRVAANWSKSKTGGDDYSQGTPMGGQLKPTRESIANNAVPDFFVEASRDPKSASLDRIQMIKGWIDNQGNTHETIYNLAWSGDREIDSRGKLSPVRNSVNLKTGTYDNHTGSDLLTAQWSDPDFEPKQAAFYYVRVLEIPTPRHSLLDAIAIQERAYTSSIWYQPQ